MSLYKEDPEGEIMDLNKIEKTIDTLTAFPEKGKIVIFEREGYVVGYSILIFYWSNEYGGDILNIDELYIKSEHRNNGYATDFLKYLVKEYKNKAKALMLEVTPSNTKAYNYYKNLGFKETVNKHMIRVIIDN